MHSLAKSVKAAALVVAAVLSFSSVSLAGENAPLPPHSVEQPGPDVPAWQAAYSGVWAGYWDAHLHHILVVEQIQADGVVKAIYSWGKDNYWQIYEDGWRRITGSFEDDELVFPGSTTVRYQLNEDGELEGKYRSSGGGRAKGRFEKVGADG